MGLSQSNLHDIADAYGIKIYGSQFSHLENAKLEPKTELFIALGKLMEIFEEGEFKKITKRTTKDKLASCNPKAIHLTSGKFKGIFSPMHWWGCFVGQIQPPEEYTLSSEEIAKRFSEKCRETFERGWVNAKDVSKAKKESWNYISENVSKNLKGKLGEVLTGLDDFSPDEFKKINKNNLLKIIGASYGPPENYERLQEAMNNLEF